MRYRKRYSDRASFPPTVLTVSGSRVRAAQPNLSRIHPAPRRRICFCAGLIIADGGEMSREKSIRNSASSLNGICTNVCVGNAFMRSETPANLCGSLDGTMERHAPAKPPLCKGGRGDWRYASGFSTLPGSSFLSTVRLFLHFHGASSLLNGRKLHCQPPIPPASPPPFTQGGHALSSRDTVPFNEPQMFAGVSERINPLVYESSQQIPIWRYAVFSHKYGKKRKANLPLTFPLSSYSASTATT